MLSTRRPSSRFRSLAALVAIQPASDATASSKTRAREAGRRASAGERLAGQPRDSERTRRCRDQASEHSSALSCVPTSGDAETGRARLLSVLQDVRTMSEVLAAKQPAQRRWTPGATLWFLWMVGMWVAFYILLFTDKVEGLWSTIRDLPLLVEIVLWLPPSSPGCSVWPCGRVPGASGFGPRSLSASQSAGPSHSSHAASNVTALGGLHG
jgi:hypothetical protein